MATLGVLPMAAFAIALAAAVILHVVVERPWRRPVPTLALTALAGRS